jgi:NTE family protein
MSSASLLSHEDKLRRIPFFSGLPTAMIEDLAGQLRHECYRQGEVVFPEGSVGDSLFFIESGQVKVSVGAGREERILNYLGPGNFFGEMAVLLNQRRTATVTVVIDADLWVLRKTNLSSLLDRYPSAAIQIIEELSRRLTDTIRRPVKRDTYNLVAVVGDEPWELAGALMDLTGEEVALLDLSGADLAQSVKYLPVALPVESLPPQATAQEVAERMGVLADAHDRVFVVLPPGLCEAGAKAVQLCEVVILLEQPPCDWIQNLSPANVWHIAQERADIERAARRLARRVVGLALSSGGARGLAHVGVMKVLERERIPIDMLAGTSAGAMFGALYAAGRSIESIIEFALSFHKMLNVWNLLDLSLLPRTGIVRGRRFLSYLKDLYQDATFEQLSIPFFVVAADVLTGEEIVFSSGPISEAVRASTSMVGLLMPHRVDKRFLIDGGAVNPLPASVLADRGADVIIASRTVPTMEEEKEYRRGASDSAGLDIPALLSNFQSIMERGIIQHRLGSVDVMIAPRVEAFRPTNYRPAAALIRLGEEAAERALPDIKQQLVPIAR